MRRVGTNFMDSRNGRILGFCPRSKRSILTLFFPPIALLAICTFWPMSDFLRSNLAGIFMTAASLWLVLAALVVGVSIAARD